jgi:polyisoprenoid-binding protein YceI
MKKLILAAFLWIAAFYSMVEGQRYFTKTGTIRFYSYTPLEDIEATAKTANAVLDLSTGQVEMAVLIKSFIFPKALMQEHFNENYMESTKFPKAVFKGFIRNISEFNMQYKGRFKGKVEGTITIHGVSQSMDNVVNLDVKDGKIVADIDFNVKPSDHQIKIPDLVRDNIAKEIKVNIQATLEEFKKTQ